MGLDPGQGIGNDALGRNIVTRWRPYLEANAQGREDIGAVLGWCRIESGGNPCAGGSAATDEIGIAQFNMRLDGGSVRVRGESGTDLGFERADILAACHADGSPPTDDEANVQADATMRLVRDCMQLADDALAKNNVSADGADYWAFVKMSHASGAGWRDALAVVVARSGAPSSFADFREAVMTLGASAFSGGIRQLMQPGSSKLGLRNRLDDCFANAIECASYADGTSGSGGGLPGILAGCGAAIVALLWALFGRGVA